MAQAMLRTDVSVRTRSLPRCPGNAGQQGLRVAGHHRFPVTRCPKAHQQPADDIILTPNELEQLIKTDFVEVCSISSWNNGDGISEQEMTACKKAMMQYDENGQVSAWLGMLKDGALSQSEVANIRQTMSAGIFGRTEWDMKVPGMKREEHLTALRRVLLGLNCAAVLSNMDRVDMSIGIIPISQEMGWDKGTAGLVQSSFFQGFLLSQLPSGLLVNSLNARKLLMAGVLVWSAATALGPLAVNLAQGKATVALALPALCATRFLVGIGQGCVDASIVDTISRWAPSEERSRSSGFTFNGYNMGMVVGLLLGPWLCLNYGWRSLFYAFGALGVVWAAWWAVYVLPLPQPPKAPASNTLMARPSSQLQQPQQQQQQKRKHSASGSPQRTSEIPFRAILANRVVQGLCITHFIYGWGIFSLSAWLPTYITETLGLGLSDSAFLSLLPPMGGIIVGFLATATADNLVRLHGWSLTHVRRAAQVGCFLLPAICFAGTLLSSNATTSLGLIMAGQSFHGLAMAGIWSSHADVLPQYGGLLASITSTCSSVAGALAVAGVGSLYKATGSWDVALVGPLIAMYMVGALSWTTMVVNAPQQV